MSHVEYGISNETPDTLAALIPNAAPKKQKRKERGSRTDQAANKSKQKYKDIAEDDHKFEDFAFALTGKTADERTPEENAALAQLRKEMRNGEISPEVLEADPANSGGDNRLPPGARGAYISGEPGEEGRILLSPNLRGGQLQRTSDEEQGEALADRAEELGITVADGDVGARVSRVASGGSVTREDDPDLFTDQESDTVMVVSDGEVVEAEADAGSTPAGHPLPPDTNYAIGGNGTTYDISTEQGKMDYLSSFDSDGNGWLSASELAQVEGISEDQANRLVKVYGMANKKGQYFIPATVETGFEGAGVDNMVNDGTVEIFTSGPGKGHYADVRFGEISPNSAANAMIRAAGHRRYTDAKKDGKAGDKGVSDFTREVEAEGMTADEMGAASNFVFGDRKPLNSSNGHARAIVGDFTGSDDGRVKAGDLEAIFETGAIQIAPTDHTSDAPEDFVPISAHRGKRPPINDGEDFNAYLQKFDTDGTPGLSEEEFEAAIKHYFGDNTPSDAEIDQLYLMFSTYDPQNGRHLTDAGAEAMITEGVLSPTREHGHVVQEWNLTPARAQTAIFADVAEQRGVPADSVVFITDEELSTATKNVFGTAIPVSDNLKNYGNKGQNNQQTYFSASDIYAMFDDGNVGYFYPKANKDLPVGQRRLTFGTSPNFRPPTGGSDPVPTDPTAPYDVTHEDHPGTANYGTGWYKGELNVSDGQIHLTEGTTPDHLVRVTIYVPEQAMEPAHGQPAVMNPPEFRNKGPAGNTIGRVRGKDMHRKDNGDGTVTWTIRGQEKRIQKGSRLDTYLSDYKSFDDPKSASHPPGRPNLELVDRYTDENGNFVEVWGPRDHQFRTDANGNEVPIEEEPLVTVGGSAKEVAGILEDLPPEEAGKILNYMGHDAAASVLMQMDPQAAANALSTQPSDEVAEIGAVMMNTDAGLERLAEVLLEMPEVDAGIIVAELDKIPGGKSGGRTLAADGGQQQQTQRSATVIATMARPGTRVQTHRVAQVASAASADMSENPRQVHRQMESYNNVIWEHRGGQPPAGIAAFGLGFLQMTAGLGTPVITGPEAQTNVAIARFVSMPRQDAATELTKMAETDPDSAAQYLAAMDPRVAAEIILLMPPETVRNLPAKMAPAKWADIHAAWQASGSPTKAGPSVETAEQTATRLYISADPVAAAQELDTIAAKDPDRAAAIYAELSELDANFSSEVTANRQGTMVVPVQTEDGGVVHTVVATETVGAGTPNQVTVAVVPVAVIDANGQPLIDANGQPAETHRRVATVETDQGVKHYAVDADGTIIYGNEIDARVVDGQVRWFLIIKPGLAGGGSSGRVISTAAALFKRFGRASTSAADWQATGQSIVTTYNPAKPFGGASPTSSVPILQSRPASGTASTLPPTTVPPGTPTGPAAVNAATDDLLAGNNRNPPVGQFNSMMRKAGIDPNSAEYKAASSAMQQGRYVAAYQIYGDAIVDRNLDRLVQAGTITQKEANEIKAVWNTLTPEEKAVFTMYTSGLRAFQNEPGSKSPRSFFYIFLNGGLSGKDTGNDEHLPLFSTVLTSALDKLNRPTSGGKTVTEMFAGKTLPGVPTEEAGPISTDTGYIDEPKTPYATRRFGAEGQTLATLAAAERGETLGSETNPRITNAFTSSSWSDGASGTFQGNVVVHIETEDAAFSGPFSESMSLGETTLPPGHEWVVQGKIVRRNDAGEIIGVELWVKAVPVKSAQAA